MSAVNSRLGRLAIVVAATTVTACADAATQPTATAARVQRSASIEGDTLACHSGWTVINGRYVCNEQ